MSQEKVDLPVRHVSDTAWLVAAYRATESRRPDAVFKDTLAERLLNGEGSPWQDKGHLPEAPFGHWLMTVRTHLIDRLLLQRIKDGVDTVVNLATGLDTRPYRLPLPARLAWVEVDFPHVVEFKNKHLASETPRCRLSRIAADLAGQDARRALLAEVTESSRSTLVLTEGLLPYLDDEVVEGLAADLYANEKIHWWVMDVSAPSFFAWFNSDPTLVKQMIEEGSLRPAEGATVSLKFAPPDMGAYLQPFGWQLAAFTSFSAGARALGRPPLDETPEGRRAANESGIALFARSL